MPWWRVIIIIVSFFVAIILGLVVQEGWIFSISFGTVFFFFLFFPTKSNLIAYFNELKLVLRKSKVSDKTEFNQHKVKDVTSLNIAVCLSGGVDSAVSAFLLKEQGFSVTAFFMQNWDSFLNKEISKSLTDKCEYEIDYEDAKKIAEKLDIDLINVNFVKEYWKNVFKEFIKDLKKGITPNPDVLCNRKIKFGSFFKYIEKEYKDIDFIATGHYAKIRETKFGNKYLTKPQDSKKDQTYFLSMINKNHLNKIIFPLSDLTKTEVREIAREQNLVVAEKKDSTGICFIGERNFPEFIANYLSKKKGNIIHQDTNKILGKHDGIFLYTIGQRKGLNLGGMQKSLFVSKKDVLNNVIYVSEKGSENLLSKEIIVEDFNLLVSKVSDIPKKFSVKTRYEDEESIATLKHIDVKDNQINLIIESEKGISSVTKGQVLVIYSKDKCIGGGIII